MKILQQLPARCSCAVCDGGCQCGDCVACSNTALDRNISRNLKRFAIAACVVMISAGFVFFVPVVALAATPTVTQTVSLRVDSADNGTLRLGSIGYCYLGMGAVFVHGAYYPAAALNQSTSRVCSTGG